jgi:hypothetical protein
VVVAEGGDARQDAVVEDDLAAVLADAGVGPARRLLRVRDDGRVDDLGRGIRQRRERAGVATAWSKPPSPLVLRAPSGRPSRGGRRRPPRGRSCCGATTA